MRNLSVFTVDVLVRVEDALCLRTLGERFVLQLAQVVLTLLFRNLFCDVVLVWQVRLLATKGSAFTNLALLGRIGQEVTRSSHDVAFVVFEVLLDLNAVSLVRIGGLNLLFDNLSWFESEVVTRYQVSVFF